MKRYLITSALPYINGVKHLGNLVGSMLPADAYARFLRMRGHTVLYICATDEHGTPAELAASKQGIAVDQYCEHMHTVQSELYDAFRISFDWFGRSHSKQNHIFTQHFYNKLDEQGMLDEVTTDQVYSMDDGRFLPDRYVEGICPHCGYENARGDQCESCTRVLDPIDLLEPRSAISGSTRLEIRPSKHLFLRQSQMFERLREWIDAKENWSILVRSIAKKWLDEGLKDRSITRDLDWGIPVSYKDQVRPGFADKVFYVWFDAPIEYISATAEWAYSTGNEYRSWWREDEGAADVYYVQFMGKDNVPFHTVGFPVTLFGSGEPWKIVDQIKGLNWMNYYGGKFSTSQQRGVFMDQALELLPSDYWRWYLLANAPETQDSSFTWESLQSTINKDLADVLGNFVNRVVRFCVSCYDAKVPKGGEYGPLEAETTALLEEQLEQLTRHMENIEFRKSTAQLRRMWVTGNEYLQKAEPWKMFKTDPVAAGVSIRYAQHLIHLFATLCSPFIPDAADKMADTLNVNKQLSWPTSIASVMEDLIPGAKITTLDLLFKKIEDEQVEEWIQRFGGPQVRS